MKVVHISTFHSGGAGVAALRLHLGLLNIGVDSHMLVLHKTKDLPSVTQWNSKVFNPLSFKILNKLGFPQTQEQKKIKLTRSIKANYEYLSFPQTDFRIDKHELLADCDVINLHWVSEFLDYTTFFKNIDKPIVWTLHDLNPTKGIFHYLSDSVTNNNLLGPLDTSVQKQKEDILSASKNISVAAPCGWMKETSLSSKALGEKPHYLINYGLDSSLFICADSMVAREKLGLPLDKNILLFVSDRTDNLRKGFHLIKEIVKNLSDDILIVVAGTGTTDMDSDKLRYLGKIDQVELSKLYSASGALLLTSREDNLPNVMLEAFMCGLPVIGFPVGGIKEHVIPGLTGILSNGITSEDLMMAIQSFMNEHNAFDRDKIRSYAVENFDQDIQASKYLSVYKQIVFN